MGNNPNNKKDHWFRDFVSYGLNNHFFFWWVIVIASVVAWICLPILGRLHKVGEVVIIYTSQDQEYAEPIFNNFTKQTGIKVRPVYDNEAAKTVGLVNRLIAEKNNPQCDVFWNNEQMRTRQLAREGVVSNHWATFGYRTRQIVVNTNLLSLLGAPHDCLALTNHDFFGKVAVAYPLFGTTSTHFLALRQKMGETGWQNWCRALAANKPFVVDGNSVVVKMVGRGEALVGLTDSDDIRAGQRETFPVHGVLLVNDALTIPNTAAIVTGSPHPTAAQKLIDYLKSSPVHLALERAGAIEPGTDVGDNSLLEIIPDDHIDWTVLLAAQNTNLDFLKGLFLR